MEEVKQILEAAQLKFNSFIDQIENDKLNDVALRRAIKKYDVKNFKIKNVTPLRARSMFNSLYQKYRQTESYTNCWLENQRRIFIFVLICYLHKHKLQIEELKSNDLQFLHGLFPLKDARLIKFQSFSVVKKQMKSMKWSQNEDKILVDIIKQLHKIFRKNTQQENKWEWGNIARQLFSNSGQKFYRSPKHCRERWQNHLDPTKIKGKWQIDHQILLFKQVLNSGKKWSKIAEKLNGIKNQHMVKNRYKSVVHKVQKQYKGKKMSQNQIISKILKRLEQQKNGYQHQQSQQSGSEQSSYMVQLKKQNNRNKGQKQKRQARKNSIKGIISEERQSICDNKKNQKTSENIKPLFQQEQVEHIAKVSRRNNCHIIIQPNQQHKQQILLDQSKNKQENGLIEINGDNFANLNKGQLEMFDRVVRDPVPTPMIENNRFQTIFDPRSPVNFMLSPFSWTPTIFLVEDPQKQMSPQIGFSSFCSKFTNQFYKFVGDENNENKN